LADVKVNISGQVLPGLFKAYVFATLVDDFGDVPYSEIDHGRFEHTIQNWTEGLKYMLPPTPCWTAR
jgi:hypothetical protein